MLSVLTSPCPVLPGTSEPLVSHSTSQKQEAYVQRSLKGQIINTGQKESISQNGIIEGTSDKVIVLSISPWAVDSRESNGLSKTRGVVKILRGTCNIFDLDDSSEPANELTNVVIYSIIPTRVIPITEALYRVIRACYDNTVCDKPYDTALYFNV